MNTQAEPTWSLPADHPVFAGHFPGQPIIPGAMLLDHVLQTAATRLNCAYDRLRIDSAKFIHPVGPDQAIHVMLEPASRPDSWRFSLKTTGQTLASGSLSLSEVAAE